jgi:hypothetical protein
MSELEFDRLLDAVSMAIAPAPEDEETLDRWAASNEAPAAANDNETAWPLFPFPQGWYAAC